MLRFDFRSTPGRPATRAAPAQLRAFYRIRLDLPVAGRTIVPVHTNPGGEPMTHALTIGQLAKATGVASKTIRYYEQIGVLPTPSRSPSRYRQYPQSAVQRRRFLRRARSLMTPLPES